MEKTQDILLFSFRDPRFQQAFQQYFAEMGIRVKDWEGLFLEMDSDGRGNQCWLRLKAGQTVGFIQFCPLEMSSWFFTKKAGFIREFWVAEAFRGQGHGSALLELAEEHFRDSGCRQAMLTTSTAEEFYIHRGYRYDEGYAAKNGERVLVKPLSRET